MGEGNFGRVFEVRFPNISSLSKLQRCTFSRVKGTAR
jgi:hypothetical protein